MLSRRARVALGRLGKRGKGSKYLLQVNGHGERFTADGRMIIHKGVDDLIEAGVLIPCEDGLLPGMTQTYRFNPEASV